MEKLILSGAVFLALSLVLAWLLVAVKYMGWFTALFKNAKYLLSAHLDYTFMAILNWVVYLMYASQKVNADERAVWLIIAGSFLNPFLFVVMSIVPDVSKKPTSLFGMISSVSFLLTTSGYLWATAQIIGWV